MHFHLPKPLHGWREFAGEVGIIVVGVLIALAAEQVVETAHWQERARHARSSLRGELAGHYGDAVEWRAVQPCISAQLQRLRQGLLASGQRLNPAPSFNDGELTFALRAPSRPYPDSVWQGVLAEGLSSHLSDNERVVLGSYYRQARDLDDLDKKITESAARLNSLTQPIPLDPMARLSLLQSIDEADDTNRWMGIITGQMIGFIDELRMAPRTDDLRNYLAHSGTLSFCRGHHLPVRSLAAAAKPTF
jgi:hypothetical protein